jgi:hypothetical protein
MPNPKFVDQWMRIVLCYFVVFLGTATSCNAEHVVSTDRELGAALSNARDGDVVALRPKRFGKLSISGGRIQIGNIDCGPLPKTDVAIEVRSTNPSQMATIRGIHVGQGGPWKFSHLLIKPASGTVAVNILADRTIVQDCEIDFGNSATWTAAEWTRNAGDGIRVRSGKRVQLLRNRLKSVADGINVYPPATHVRVLGNTIENFCMDGIRALGDFGLFENNVVRNAHVINDNHCDMLQSWSTGKDGKPGTGTITGVAIRGNQFYAHTDPKQLHLRRGRSGVQGIGMFNGRFKDFVIENNLIVADHFHGISVYNAENVRIEKNTVVDFDTQFPGPPWIVVKNYGKRCRIANNIRMKAGKSDDAVVQENNVEIKYSEYRAWFRDPARGDFRLRTNVPTHGVGYHGITKP